MCEIDQAYTNRIIHFDCVEGLRYLPSECIPLTLTSPPYDTLRHYGGHRFDQAKFQEIAEELYRITTPGGVVVWVVQERIRWR